MRAFEAGSDLRGGLARWISYYNNFCPHSALGGQAPDEAYAGTRADGKEAEKLVA
ncbi:MAG: integrase core domain-containing protein [Rhodospirillales bacterium]|nr:integrase core domain-containing protein [Rhodospirillales bacterium]MDE2574346.1 integrase core domain-containing protein [Rhodospirillales bacterium]